MLSPEGLGCAEPPRLHHPARGSWWVHNHGRGRRRKRRGEIRVLPGSVPPGSVPRALVPPGSRAARVQPRGHLPPHPRSSAASHGTVPAPESRRCRGGPLRCSDALGAMAPSQIWAAGQPLLVVSSVSNASPVFSGYPERVCLREQQETPKAELLPGDKVN